MKNPLAWIRDRFAKKPTTLVRNVFAGAAYNRLQGDWGAVGRLSADKEIQQDLPTLRVRSRRLAQDNPHIAGAVLAFQDNVVGWNGIRLQARLEKRGYAGAASSLHDTHNTSIEDAWGRFCRFGNPTVDGRHSMVDLQRLWEGQQLVDGEYLVREIVGYPNEWGYALQVLDPDQLDDTYNVQTDSAGNQVRMGVELNAVGKVAAYYILSTHPSESGFDKKRVRVPADQIIHRFIAHRSGQTRGYPATTPVLIGMKDLDRYTISEITQANLAASNGGFFVAKGDNADLVNTGVDSSEGTRREALVMEAEAGMSRQLPPGWEFQPWNSDHPNGNFAAFHKTMLRNIARGLGISYTTLSGDLEGVNFTSSRVGLLQERDTYRAHQRRMGCQTMSRIYTNWLRMAYLSGRVTLPSPEVSKWATYHEWEYRGWPSVQPVEDIDAAERAIKLGVLTRREVCAAEGRDDEETFAGLKREKELAAKYDIDISGTDKGQGNGQTQAQDPTANPDAAPGDVPTDGAAGGGKPGRAHPDLALIRGAR